MAFRSRLIFLNLPPTLNPTVFQATLKSPSSLSDCSITDTKLVPKRRFAFVGYKDAEEARKVRDWFDGSYMFGGSKVKVDFVKDESLRNSKKLNGNKTALTTKEEKENKAVTGEKEVGNKRLKDFMDVMKGVDSTSALIEASSSSTAEGTNNNKSRKGKERSPPAELDEDDDAAWLKKRRAALEGEETIPKLSGDEELILSTARLFVRNLAFITSSESLSSHFSQYGQIDECHLPVSSTTGESLGTAFLQFHKAEDALEAYKSLDKTTFQGRLLHVLPGRAKPGKEGIDTVASKILGKTDKERGEVKNKADVRHKEESARGLNWATLYMNSDAVAASVAARMGISKADLLNPDSGSAAVKLALAETTVIEETKKYFEDAGIVLEALQPKVPRSQTVILIKNIPFGTTVQTLTDLFVSHGELKRVLLPPTGTIGVVEFENHMDAGRAFKALAYRRLGNAVLYLEKGPAGMFKSDPGEKIVSTQQKLEEEAKALADKIAGIPEEANEDDEAGATLYLKGLNFATTTAHLQAVLSTLPGFSFARVQTKPDPKRHGERLSMGYGFVGFRTREAASKALKGLEGFEVDGKHLQVKFAQRGTEEDREKANENGGKTKSTKVLVKNLPFEATKKDVRELFSAYGQLKSLRLPRKAMPTSTGAQSTRGFAFLEFTTHAEAARAMEALKHTHLLGRHLILEWAKEGEEIDVQGLREKVRTEVRGLDDGEGRSGKRRKLDLSNNKGEELDGLEV
ncbi:multiple RNA-binding domain-containing protein 1 [Cryptococcus depauperatus CBS 7841]|uniref:Multiple RNA-binding domain-containing protein 1 n=1 Tax=Cryptococcus depauperatus CBS 7841 TaxID=1295531 RepID=A0A1E3IXQ9_9TREE|nr:multiple RNA-binding domain-containing protein 1 [Cryptococcus depauperatus CBS 7841]